MKEIIKQINQADLSDEDWAYEIVQNIKNDYVRGYLSAKLEEIGNCLSPDTEDYREEFIICVEDAFKVC